MRASSGVLRQLLRVALAAVVFASSGVHFHPGEPLAAAQDPSPSFELRSAASHPAAPLHVESVKLERAPRCPECLVQKNHALGAPAPALAALRPSLGMAELSFLGVVLRRAGDPGQPRGPPLL